MNNTRFATLIHILTLFAKHPDQWLSSDWIAASIHINPVTVRRELSTLQRLGWVKSKKGKEGGSRLAVSSEAISIADIYTAVKRSNVLGKRNPCSKATCPIGRQINAQLEKLYDETDRKVVEVLQQGSLKTFADQFH